MLAVNVESNLEANSGSTSDWIASPKLNVILGPWSNTEVYLNYGRGFHSNDGRGMLTRVDPVHPADPLVRADTADVGIRTTAFPGLHSSATLFWVQLDSELVFVGDAGTTEPGPPSRRFGIELANHYRPKPWLAVDLDVTLADAELLDVPESANSIPGALESTLAAGVSLGREQGLFGAVRLRYFGGFPLIEDDSVRASATSLLNGRVGCAFRNGLRVVLDGFHLADREDADIPY